MDRKSFKSKPFHVITDSRSGDIKRIVTPGDLEVGTEAMPADLKIYGSMLVDSIKDLDGNNYSFTGGTINVTSQTFITNLTESITNNQFVTQTYISESYFSQSFTSSNYYISSSLGSQSDNAPNQFANLQMWYEATASHVALNFTAPVSVQNWYDMSGNGRHMSQGTKDRQPRWGTNTSLSGSLPSLEFQAGQLMSSSAVNLSTFTIIFGVQNKSTNSLLYEHGADMNSVDGCWLLANVTAGNAATIQVRRGGLFNGRDVPGGTTWATSNTLPHVFIHQWEGTQDRHLFLYDNWPMFPMINQGATNHGNAATNQPFYLGARSTLVAPMSGSVFALAIYSPAIPLFQAQKVARYFADKYGVAIL